MKKTRSLVLRSERLADLTSDQMRAVNGGVRTLLDCIVIFDPSHVADSLCDGCLTNQNCRTLFC